MLPALISPPGLVSRIWIDPSCDDGDQALPVLISPSQHRTGNLMFYITPTHCREITFIDRPAYSATEMLRVEPGHNAPTLYDLHHTRLPYRLSIH